MPTPHRRRARHRRAERAGDWIDETGRAALMWSWSVIAAVVRISIRLISAIAGPCLQWFQNQRLAARVAIAALLCTLCIALVRFRPATVEDRVWIDSDTEALARVIRSEIGSGSSQQQLHVAWATRNLARERKQSVAEMACSPCGRQERGRPVSSRQPAKDRDRELAAHVLTAPDRLDPTGGATHFINPRLQDELARSGRLPGYLGQTYDRVRRRWNEQYGWEPYYRLGPDLELWGPKRAPRSRVSRRARGGPGSPRK